MARSQTGPAFSDISSKIGVANQSQKLTGVNEDRVCLIVQNVSADTLWIDFGRDATQGAPSFRLPAGALFTMEKEHGYVDTSEVFIIGPNAGALYTAREA